MKKLLSPERAADRRREEAVDERVGCRVERGQRLNESGHGDVGLRGGHLAKHLQQVEHHVRAPAQDENCGAHINRKNAGDCQYIDGDSRL